MYFGALSLKNASTSARCAASLKPAASCGKPGGRLARKPRGEPRRSSPSGTPTPRSRVSRFAAASRRTTIDSRASKSGESVRCERERQDGRIAEQPERREEAPALAPVRRPLRLGEERREELRVAVARGDVEDRRSTWRVDRAYGP